MVSQFSDFHIQSKDIPLQDMTKMCLSQRAGHEYDVERCGLWVCAETVSRKFCEHPVKLRALDIVELIREH
jgi:hypothetical protein